MLIDRLCGTEGTHGVNCQSEFWVGKVAARETRCMVRHAPLVRTTFEGIFYDGHAVMPPSAFDLLLVDWPKGTYPFSRYDCVVMVPDNPSNEFVGIVDDIDRPGEQDTLAALEASQRRGGQDVFVNYLHGHTTQAVILTPAFRGASSFY